MAEASEGPAESVRGEREATEALDLASMAVPAEVAEAPGAEVVARAETVAEVPVALVALLRQPVRQEARAPSILVAAVAAVVAAA